METKALRVFYRKSDNKIVWQHELEGTGEFPTSIATDLEELPNQIGGVPEDYTATEERDAQRIADFQASDNNTIVNGALVIGSPRPVVEPVPPRDLLAEIDDLKALVTDHDNRLKADIGGHIR